MKNDRLGIEFIKIAAFLYFARFITAALMWPGLNNWDIDRFNYLSKYIGAELTYLAITSAIIGAFMIVISIFQQRKTKEHQQT